MKYYPKPQDKHALCSGSNTSWRNKTNEEIIEYKKHSYATTIGTLLHEYAAKNIKESFRVLKQDKHSILRYLVVDNDIPSIAVDIDRIFPTLMLYINDCIGYHMSPEEYLYYSDDYNGTADAILYEYGVLKISDLKTGTTPAKFEQLEQYAAFFCLQNNVNPKTIKRLEYRIYKDGEILYSEPEDNESLCKVVQTIIDQNKAIVSVFGNNVRPK